MAESTGSIYYTVEADTEQLLRSIKPADTSLDSLNKTFARTDKAANQTSLQMTKTAAAIKGIGHESQAASSSLGGLTKVLGGLLSLQGANVLIQMAESYREMGERIRFATATQEEYEEVQRRLLATANGTYRSLSEAQEVYILTADSLRSMEYSTEQALDITDSLSYAFVKNATSAERGANATRAYSNAIMKGKVEADGWSTIVSAVPSIIQDIAAASGMSAEEVRKLGAEGKLTAQQLNEGLRQSLDSNKAAADGMATTVRDAFNNMRNSLSVYLGESKSATSATGLLSSAIITLGDNIETVVNLLTAAGSYALAKYIAQTGQQAIAAGRAMIAARAQAAEELRLAQAHAATTAATLAHAQANVGLTGSHGQASAAAAAHTAALARLQAAQAAALSAGRLLMGVLGGPVGIIALLASAAVAALTFGRDSKKATDGVNSLTGAVDGLTASLGQLDRAGLTSAAQSIERRIEESARLAVNAQDKIQELQAQLQKEAPGSSAAQGIIRQMEGWGAAYGEAQKQLEVFRKRAEEIRKTAERRDEARGGAAPESGPDEEAEKRLQALREERKLVELVGVARARLQAIQRLGDKASPEQKDEAARLAAEIYEIEEARRKSTAATKESTKAENENTKVLADMAEQLYQAGLSAEELAVAKARARMTAAASPEEIAQLEDLARLLFRVQELERKRAEFGTGKKADEYIMGQTDPLSGGMFDEQYARYEAEAQAEQERYAAQLERLKQARDLQIETQRSYDDLEQQAAQDHANRMAQIDQAKQQLMLSSASNAFGSLADVMKQSQGEQSAIYKAMFAASKAFAIAESIVAIQTGIAKAAAQPFPKNLVAMASVAAATANIISTIQSASMGSGRQYGGPVSAGKMYRINETGKPEILNTANGQQYLLPNTRGQVVSNKEASSNYGEDTGIKLTVQIVEDASRAGQVERSRLADDEHIVRVMVAQVMSGGEFADVGESFYGWRRRGI